CGLRVAKATAKMGARVETEPSISPASAGCTTRSTTACSASWLDTSPISSLVSHRLKVGPAGAGARLVSAASRASSRRLVPSAMARGVPIVAEKPLGLAAADVDAIADLAESAGAFAAVAFVNRMRAIWDALARLGPAAGPLSHLAVRIINGPPGRYRSWNSGWMLDPARSGGGALHNLGIHGVDAFLALTGADPEAVR